MIEDEVGIRWKFYFKEDFAIRGRIFKRGDGFEFDATLNKHGNYWLIDNIWEDPTGVFETVLMKKNLLVPHSQ